MGIYTWIGTDTPSMCFEVFTFGMLADQFGVQWTVDFESKDK